MARFVSIALPALPMRSSSLIPAVSTGPWRLLGEYTDQVYSFTWIDDFAAARNYAFSLASSEFCMWLDADDVILPEDHNKLLELKNQLAEVDTVMLRYNTAFDAQGRPSFFLLAGRIVRNDSQALWLGAVHE